MKRRAKMFTGILVTLVYILIGISVLMTKCTNGYGEGKAEVKDIILWEFLWPLPALVAFVRGIINTGRRMLDSLPKRKEKEDPEK